MPPFSVATPPDLDTPVTLAATIRLPWAAAIAYRVKPVENRGRRLAERHRGQLVAIHVGSTVDFDGMRDPRIARWLDCPPPETGAGQVAPAMADMQYLRGYIIAVARIVGWHYADVCCQPWGDREYREPGKPAVHIELDAVVLLNDPVGPVRGQIQVPWALDDVWSTAVTAEYWRSRP